jgi:iron complex outermembrane recepter protein
MRNFKLNTVAMAAMLTMLGAAHAQNTSEVGKITVTGEGDKLGTGLLIDEDTPKAKSTVTKAQLEKSRSSSNPFQALNLLPGVNASSHDATGLFGGNLRVRGFNSDQMGFTVDGAPVNDSGSFSVFPQEYADAENMCEMFVTQGATDTEAPHVGASGGNVGLVTCAPLDTFRVRTALSGGQLDYGRAFFRVDSGKVGDLKGFISYSKSQVDKWRGKGGTKRDHVDGKVEYDLKGGSKLSAGILYNRALTNNFRTLPYDNAAGTGTIKSGAISYFDDFAATPPQHLTPVNGTAQTETNPSNAYYGYALNPFMNYLATGKANLQLTPQMRLDVEPYFWYGYGTGGVQQTTLAENPSSGTRLHYGIGDINGDGDTLDTILVYRGSLTETFRPGVNVKLSYTLDNHKILGGIWYERARHNQTQPASVVFNNGGIGDRWLGNDQYLVRYNDGSLYQGRNQRTISTGESVFVQDTMDLLSSKLQVTPAVSYRRINRDYDNFANSGSNSGADYNITRTYSEVLPSLSLSFQATDRMQAFTSISKNFKAPGNFSYQGAVEPQPPIAFTNGVASTYAIRQKNPANQETSINIDVGARYRGDMFKASATAFWVDFKDRIASGFDPVGGGRFDINVGKSTIKGLEVELGTVPVMGFSGYASATYTDSRLNENLCIAGDASGNCTNYAPTADKYFPDTPRGMAALSVQWAGGPFLLNLAGKYTSGRQLTLVNDTAIPGFTTFDLNAAYQLPTPPGNFWKNPILRLNISNLTNRQYYLANAGSGSLIAINKSLSTPAVYTGAPRFTSLTFQVDY